MSPADDPNGDPATAIEVRKVSVREDEGRSHEGRVVIEARIAGGPVVHRAGTVTIGAGRTDAGRGGPAVQADGALGVKVLEARAAADRPGEALEDAGLAALAAAAALVGPVLAAQLGKGAGQPGQGAAGLDDPRVAGQVAPAGEARLVQVGVVRLEVGVVPVAAGQARDQDGHLAIADPEGVARPTADPKGRDDLAHSAV